MTVVLGRGWTGELDLESVTGWKVHPTRRQDETDPDCQRVYVMKVTILTLSGSFCPVNKGEEGPYLHSSGFTYRHAHSPFLPTV